MWAKKNIKVLFFHPCMWLWSLALSDFIVFLNLWKQQELDTFAKSAITCCISAAAEFHRSVGYPSDSSLLHKFRGDCKSQEYIYTQCSSCVISHCPITWPTLPRSFGVKKWNITSRQVHCLLSHHITHCLTRGVNLFKTDYLHTSLPEGKFAIWRAPWSSKDLSGQDPRPKVYHIMQPQLCILNAIS